MVGDDTVTFRTAPSSALLNLKKPVSGCNIQSSISSHYVTMAMKVFALQPLLTTWTTDNYYI